MPALQPITGKNCKTKEQMVHYRDDTLRPALAGCRLLRQALKDQVDAWSVRLDRLADAPEGKLTEPDKSHYVDSAFQHGHETLAQQYFSSLDELGKFQVGSNNYRKTTRKVLRIGDQLEKSGRAYDQKLLRYNAAYQAYQDENEDDSVYQRRIAPYKAEVDALRATLRDFVVTFNSRVPFDEPYSRDLDENLRFGYRYAYASYKPHKHGWFPDASTGTYIYDYPSNRMQLHLHYKEDNRAKPPVVRFKLYSDKHGLDFGKNWGLVKHLTETYPPVYDEAWHYV